MPEKIDVAAQLDTLIKLQVIDTQIYQLNHEKQKKPRELAQLEAEFKQKNIGVKNAEEKFTAVQLKKKEKEGALVAKEEQIKKLQGQLYQIKTNKEYSAMQHEVESQKADKSLIEDDILVLMDEIDKAKTEISKEKENLAKEEVNLKEQQKLVHSQVEEIEKKLQLLNADRQTIVPQLDPSVLKKYEKILKSKNGLAITSVKDDACQGCNMNMPPQVINQIRMKQEFIVCESCARFLYINDNAE